jgi:hypothetical protein
MEPPFPTSGNAHVRVDATKTQVVVTLMNINVNGLDGRTVRLDYPLVSYIPTEGGDTVSWSRTKHETGLIERDPSDNSKPGDFLMMTSIPGVWPAWVHKTADSMDYYGVFTCQKVF